MSIEYLPDDVEVIEKPLLWQRMGLQQTATGYGKKLTTSKMVKYNGKLYRVYCICYSNVGSCWIKTRGRTLYLRG